MKLHLVTEEEESKWIREHPIFSIIFTISVSIVLTLLSMGFKNGFVDAGVNELSIFFSYLCMFLAGMYLVGFYISLLNWKIGKQESKKKHDEKGVSEG